MWETRSETCKDLLLQPHGKSEESSYMMAAPPHPQGNFQTEYDCTRAQSQSTVAAKVDIGRGLASGNVRRLRLRGCALYMYGMYCGHPSWAG